MSTTSTGIRKAYDCVKEFATANSSTVSTELDHRTLISVCDAIDCLHANQNVLRMSLSGREIAQICFDARSLFTILCGALNILRHSDPELNSRICNCSIPQTLSLGEMPIRQELLDELEDQDTVKYIEKLRAHLQMALRKADPSDHYYSLDLLTITADLAWLIARLHNLNSSACLLEECLQSKDIVETMLSMEGAIQSFLLGQPACAAIAAEQLFSIKERLIDEGVSTCDHNLSLLHSLLQALGA